MEKRRVAVVFREMSYRRIPMTMQPYRRLWRKQRSISATRMYGAVLLRPQVLTVPVLCAGYLPTAAYTICHEPPHRAFMTSVLRYQQVKPKRGILSFLQFGRCGQSCRHLLRKRCNDTLRRSDQLCFYQFIILAEPFLQLWQIKLTGSEDLWQKVRE